MRRRRHEQDARASALTNAENGTLAHLIGMREIGDARRRLAEGSISRCVDCGGEIGFERLTVNSVAFRCLAGQDQQEGKYAPEPMPGL